MIINFAASNTGYKSAASNTGDYSAASNTGACSAASADDPTAVAVAWGHEAKAKGCKGAHLVLADWRYVGEKDYDGDYETPFDKNYWQLAGARMFVVDGKNIKEDTWYSFVNGELKELVLVEED